MTVMSARKRAIGNTWKYNKLHFEECREPKRDHIFINLQRVEPWLKYYN